MNLEDIRPKALLMFGPPGSGKGTIGALLADACSHYHLSTGDIFRGLPADSESGKLFYGYASKGNLVPDDVTVEIWKNYTLGLIATNRFDPSKQILLLDGIPRTRTQAELMDKYVDVVQVLNLEIKNEDVVVNRILGRAKIEGRADDADESIIRNRLANYHKATAEVLEHYSAELITTINGEGNRMEALRDSLAGLMPVFNGFIA